MSSTSSADFVNKLCKNSIESWIKTHFKGRKTVDHVEGYVIGAAVLLLILLVLGPCRRRSRNVVIQYGVRGAYLMSFPLLTYTWGLMQGVIKNNLYPVWATFLVLVFGGANSVSVQKLDENKQWLKLMLDNFLYLLYLGTILGNSEHFGGKMVFIPATIMTCLVSVRNVSRISALTLAVDPRGSGSSMVVCYMKNYEQALSAEEGYNPHTMQGYNYLIHPFNDEGVHLPQRPRKQAGDIQEVRDKVITLEKIWCHGNGILSSVGGDPVIHHLKDVCLSFALFRLAVRRYFGYACAESGLQKTSDLVLQGLLPRGDECERAFQVIEVELAFLYDFFFTRYATTMYYGEKRSFLVSLGTTTLFIYIGAYGLAYLNEKSENLWEYGVVDTETQDVIVTKAILCALAVFQVLQICLYASSDWAKVSMVCKYYMTEASMDKGSTFYCICIEKALMFIGKLSLFLDQLTWFQRWEKKIGQYSLIDCFYYPGNRFLERQSEIIPMFREGRKAGTSIPVPMEVKKAIAWALKESNGMISNGARALERYGMTQLYWACQTDDEVTLTHVIMIWHVATSYCELPTVSRTEAIAQGSSRLVATSLSKYCGYLVAFAPELLPGNSLETNSMLDELVHEARFHIGNGTNKYEKLRGLTNDNEMLVREQRAEEGVLTKGAILGMTLESMEDQVTRWKLLADFWAELILYMAPSDNVSGHIEHLANGGEFVTHIWALLMHAGILERPVTRASGR